MYEVCFVKLCTTNVLTVNRSSKTQIKTQLQSNITEGGNCDICNSLQINRNNCTSLLQDILSLYLITIFLTETKQLLFELPFNFKSPVHPLIHSLFSIFTFLDHPVHLKGINESMQSNSGLPNTHSLSAYCSVTAVGCCQFLQTTAIYSADWFISSVSPPPSIPPSRTPHTQRACAPGQDSGHCAQLSFRVASESAGCDFRLARVIIILSYMGIIREAIISQYSHILVSFQSNW